MAGWIRAGAAAGVAAELCLAGPGKTRAHTTAEAVETDLAEAPALGTWAAAVHNAAAAAAAAVEQMVVGSRGFEGVVVAAETWAVGSRRAVAAAAQSPAVRGTAWAAAAEVAVPWRRRARVGLL